MKRWPTKPLGELCEFRHGNTPSKAEIRNWGGSFPWVSPKDMRTEIISDTQDHLSSEAIANNRAAIAKKNSLLVVVRSGILAHTFPVAIAGRDVAFNQDLKALRVVSSATTPRYIFRFLQASSPQILTHGTKRGATVHSLQSGFLELLPAPMPPLAEQERIMKLLDEADELRKLRAQADRRTADLIPALFHEMFGDPVENSKGWPCVQLVGLCGSADDIKCGPFGTQLSKSEYTEKGVPLWGIKNVNALFELPTQEFLTPSTAQRLIQYSIEPWDIVMTRKGTVGNCAVYPERFPLGIMHSDLLRLRVSHEKCEPVFLAHQLHSSRDVERQLAQISGGAVMPGINVTKLKSLKVLAPPLPLQKEFAARVSEIRAVQAVQTISRRRLNDLFQSMLHRAFEGEL